MLQDCLKWSTINPSILIQKMIEGCSRESILDRRVQSFSWGKKKKSVSGPCPGWGLDISAGATAPGLTLRLWTQPMSCRTCTICYILTLRAFTNFSHRRGPKYPHNRDTWARTFANSCGAVARTKGKATTTVVPTSQNAYSAYEAEKMGMWR